MKSNNTDRSLKKVNGVFKTSLNDFMKIKLNKDFTKSIKSNVKIKNKDDYEFHLKDKESTKIALIHELQKNKYVRDNTFILEALKRLKNINFINLYNLINFHEVIPFLKCVHIKKGEIIYVQGESSVNMYSIINGSIEFYRHTLTYDKTSVKHIKVNPDSSQYSSNSKIKEIIKKLKLSALKPSEFISKIITSKKDANDIITEITNLKLSKNFSSSYRNQDYNNANNLFKIKLKNDDKQLSIINSDKNYADDRKNEISINADHEKNIKENNNGNSNKFNKEDDTIEIKNYSSSDDENFAKRKRKISNEKNVNKELSEYYKKGINQFKQTNIDIYRDNLSEKFKNYTCKLTKINEINSDTDINFFGHKELLNNIQRINSVVATEDSVMITLNSLYFKKYLSVSIYNSE